MKRRMTKAWLRSYEPTHPFAADFRDDALGDRCWPAPASLRALRTHMCMHNACDEAHEGARVAWRDFSKVWIRRGDAAVSFIDRGDEAVIVDAQGDIDGIVRDLATRCGKVTEWFSPNTRRPSLSLLLGLGIYDEWQEKADDLIDNDLYELLEPAESPTFDFRCTTRQLRTVLHHLRREGSGFHCNRGTILRAWEEGGEWGDGELGTFSDGTGLLVFTVGDDYVIAEIAWVHQSFRRRGRATHMIQALRERFPGHELKTDPVTLDGRLFVESLI